MILKNEAVQETSALAQSLQVNNTYVFKVKVKRNLNWK